MKSKYPKRVIVSILLVSALASLVFISQVHSLSIDLGGGEFVRISLTTSGAGYLATLGPNLNDNIRLSSTSGTNGNHGFVSVRGAVENSFPDGGMYVHTNGYGRIDLAGPNNNGNITLSALSNNVNHGHIQVENANGNGRAGIYVNSSGHGRVFVQDANGVTQAYMYVNDSGQGIISADVKAFIEDHPNEPETKIVYVSLEGPEAGMYHRGRGMLVGGQALVELPEHFTALAAMDTASVQLTPHSGISQGLSVSTINEDSFEVLELFNGRGNYEFSFTITAARERFRDHNPIVNDSTKAIGSGLSILDGSDSEPRIGPRERPD